MSKGWSGGFQRFHLLTRLDQEARGLGAGGIELLDALEDLDRNTAVIASLIQIGELLTGPGH